MIIDEGKLISRYIYLENEFVLSKLELERKNVLLQINLLRDSIARNKYIVDDKSLTPEDSMKIASLSPAFTYERNNLTEPRRNMYLMTIAKDEEELKRYLEYLGQLEMDIKKSNDKIEALRNGKIPGLEDPSKSKTDEDPDKDDNVILSAPIENEEDKDKDKDIGVVPVGEGTTEGAGEAETEVKTEGKDDPAVVPVPVKNVVDPKPSLWKKIGKMIGGGILALAALVGAGYGGYKVMEWARDKGEYEESDQERPTPTPVPTPRPVPTPPEFKPIDEIEPVQPWTNIPEEIINPTPEPTPAPTPEPTPTPTPEPTPAPEAYVPIKLDPGEENVRPPESAFNLETGVEVTADGTTYTFGQDGSVEQGHADVSQDENGFTNVSQDDFTQQQAPTPLPPTGNEVDYNTFIDNASPEDAAALNEAMGEVDWNADLDAAFARTLHQ